MSTGNASLKVNFKVYFFQNGWNQGAPAVCPGLWPEEDRYCCCLLQARKGSDQGRFLFSNAIIVYLYKNLKVKFALYLSPNTLPIWNVQICIFYGEGGGIFLENDYWKLQKVS